MKFVLRRLVLPVALFLVWAPAAQAWSWPVQGPVLQPFVYDEAHPYDAGQHRGIDIGAEAVGESVIAPAAGTVSFVGTVPTSGTCVTIQTPDGYSVTLTHLGSILTAKGAAVAEGDAVGTIGPSGTPEFAQPYVHLGIRTTSDPDGYVDPLGFLPAIPTGDPTQTTTSQPSTSAASGAAARATRRSHARPSHSHARPQHGRGQGSELGSSEPADESAAAVPQEPQSARGQRASERPASHLSTPRSGHPRHSPMPHRGLDEPTSSWRRPGVETAAPRRTGAGNEIQPGVNGSSARQSGTQLTGGVLPLVLNGAAAVVAIAAAFAVARRRRGTAGGPFAAAEILHLSRLRESGRVREAA